MRLILLMISATLLSACVRPEAEFWSRIVPLCGNTFKGELVSNDEADAKFRDLPLKVSFDSCSDDRIDMTFLADDAPYSQWTLTRKKNTLELRHGHTTGVTGYGGFSDGSASGSRINFPADDTTKDLFDAAGLEVSKQNIWALEARSGAVFVYEMARPGRLFRIAFRTTNPVTGSAGQAGSR